MIQEPDSYLHLRQIGFCRESDHLKEASDSDEDAIKEKILEMYRQGKPQREIATAVGFSTSKVNRFLKSING